MALLINNFIPLYMLTNFLNKKKERNGNIKIKITT